MYSLINKQVNFKYNPFHTSLWKFLKDKEQNNWTFNKSAIAVSDVQLDDRIIQQYENINNPAPPLTQPGDSTGDVVKLFDDED